MNTLINRIENLIQVTSTCAERNELTNINIILHQQLNLCDTCKHSIPTCGGGGTTDGSLVFGNGRGNDNIIKCKSYEYKT